MRGTDATWPSRSAHPRVLFSAGSFTFAFALLALLGGQRILRKGMQPIRDAMTIAIVIRQAGDLS